MSQKAIVLFVLVAAVTLSAQGSYFPKGALSDDPRGDLFRANWYSKQLKALEEPSLLQLAKNPSLESYRFVWLRTFHHPVVVRLDPRSDGTGELTTKVSSGAGGYAPGHVIENKSRAVTREEAERFLARVRQAQFWGLPSHDTPEAAGDDGSQWIIEGVKEGKYHMVDRWTPETGPVRDLGVFLFVELAQMKIPKSELY
jgi:hypothetical protein